MTIIIKFFKPHTASLLIATLIVVCLAQYQLGFILNFFLLVWIFWLPYSAYRIITNSVIRQHQIVRVLIWLIAAAIIGLAHTVQHNHTRNAADVFVMKIQAFTDKYHRYPSSISEVGVSEDELNSQLGLSYYSLNQLGRPSFVYATSFEPFSTFSYDFDARVWEYLPD
ncbi:hypothetical protein [Undibacterium sp. Di24W]|uniref:hypothetical protein n=1 Tax=Undibacterium sp. Di24W TaxID=3413033 RepID=UPI003BF41179